MKTWTSIISTSLLGNVTSLCLHRVRPYGQENLIQSHPIGSLICSCIPIWSVFLKWRKTANEKVLQFYCYTLDWISLGCTQLQAQQFRPYLGSRICQYNGHGYADQRDLGPSGSPSCFPWQSPQRSKDSDYLMLCPQVPCTWLPNSPCSQPAGMEFIHSLN